MVWWWVGRLGPRGGREQTTFIYIHPSTHIHTHHQQASNQCIIHHGQSGQPAVTIIHPSIQLSILLLPPLSPRLGTYILALMITSLSLSSSQEAEPKTNEMGDMGREGSHNTTRGERVSSVVRSLCSHACVPCVSLNHPSMHQSSSSCMHMAA